MSTALKKKPEIVIFPNGQKQISTQRWNDDLVMEYVVSRVDEWITTKDLAQFIYGSTMCRFSVRRNVPRLFWLFFEKHKKFLVRHYGGKKKQVVKIKLIKLDEAHEHEINELKKFAKKKWKHHDLTSERYEEVTRTLDELLDKKQIEEDKAILKLE